MSEPTPTLDAYIEAADRIAKAWSQTVREIYEDIQPAAFPLSRLCIHLNDEGYTYELMFPEGNEEWDVFV